MVFEGALDLRLMDRRTGKAVLQANPSRQAADLLAPVAARAALRAVGRKAGTDICQALADRLASAAAPVPASQSRPATAKRTIFAVPLENATGQDQYDPAAAGLGDLLAVLLAKQENITVVERRQLEHLTAEQARTLQGLTGDQHATAAGRLLRADTVLTGRLLLIGDKLTISVKAIEISASRVLASDQLSCRPADLLETSLQLARNLGKQMSLPLPEIDLKQVDASPIAGLHFAKALGHYYAGDMDSAIMQFMRTLDLDPDYTEAAKKLLADAKQREKDSPVPRLGPTTKTATRASAPAK